MNIEQITADLWAGFSIEPEPEYCAYGEKFKQWTETLYASISRAMKDENANAAVAVNQAKVQLVDKYFEWRAAAPKAHRNRSGEGHLCLFHVFDDTYCQ